MDLCTCLRNREWKWEANYFNVSWLRRILETSLRKIRKKRIDRGSVHQEKSNREMSTRIEQIMGKLNPMNPFDPMISIDISGCRCGTPEIDGDARADAREMYKYCKLETLIINISHTCCNVGGRPLRMKVDWACHWMVKRAGSMMSETECTYMSLVGKRFWNCPLNKNQKIIFVGVNYI